MATEVQNGTAVVFGITNSGTPIAIEGFATFLLNNAKLSHKFDLEAVKDANNFDAALIATNGHRELAMTWAPSGASRAAAIATLAVLQPLAKVELSNFGFAAVNGKWIYVGDEEIDLSQKVAKFSLKLRQYDDTDQNNSLTTPVVG